MAKPNSDRKSSSYFENFSDSTTAASKPPSKVQEKYPQGRSVKLGRESARLAAFHNDKVEHQAPTVRSQKRKASLTSKLKAARQILQKNREMKDTAISTPPTRTTDANDHGSDNAEEDTVTPSLPDNQVASPTGTLSQPETPHSTSTSLTIELDPTDAARSPPSNAQPKNDQFQGPQMIYPPFDEANVSRTTEIREISQYRSIRDDLGFTNFQVRYEYLLDRWNFDPKPHDRDTWVPAALVQMCSFVNGAGGHTKCRVCGQELFYDKVARAHEDAAHCIAPPVV